MARYVLKRCLQAVPLLLFITFLCFLLMHLAPYDVVDSMVSDRMTAAEIEAKREALGLNDNVFVQYFRWLGSILSGDLGYSLINRTDIASDLLARIPNTIALVLPAYVSAFLLAIVLGLVAAHFKDSWVDKAVSALANVGIAVPTFWVALLVMYVFACELDWFPVMGMHSIGDDSLGDFLWHFVLPYLVLLFGFLPDLVRYVRSSAITQLQEDYVTVQKSLGASRPRILFGHVARAVLLPLLAKLGLSLPLLVTGAVITETVFAWPGIGQYFVTAIRTLDYPVVLAVLLLSGSLVILGNLLADVLCAIADPRVRVGGDAE